MLGIGEMLEKILLSLPEQDLLIAANRVCKTWNTFIKDSPLLQQKLFFEPAPGPSRLRLVNPQLGEEADESDRSTGVYHKIELNSLHRKWWNKVDCQTRWASYRRMLLCQPAVHEYGGVEQKDGIKLAQIPRRYLMSLAGQEIIGVEVEGSLSS